MFLAKLIILWGSMIFSGIRSRSLTIKLAFASAKGFIDFAFCILHFAFCILKLPDNPDDPYCFPSITPFMIPSSASSARAA